MTTQDANASPTPFVEISVAELTDVIGGGWSDTVLDAAKGGFGLRSLYRGAVKQVTAAYTGWNLADQMYGTAEHGASLQEKWRARGAVKAYLDAGDKLPAWAPNW